MLQLGQLFTILLSIAILYFWFSLDNWEQYFEDACWRRDGNQTSTCEQRLHRCGDQTAGLKLKYPFRFEDDPDFCGDHRFQLSCKHNRTVLQINSTLYYYVVPDSINYEKQTIRLLDPGVHKDNCSTLPLLVDPTMFLTDFYTYTTITFLILVSCKEAVLLKSKSPLYLETASCNITPKAFSNYQNDQSSEIERFSYSYNYAVVSDQNVVASDIEENCTVYNRVPVDIQTLDSIGTGNISYRDIHSFLAINGFDLRWWLVTLGRSKRKSFRCYLMSFIYGFLSNQFDYFSSTVTIDDYSVTLSRNHPGDYVIFGCKLVALLIVGRCAIGILLLFAFLIHKWSRRHLSIYNEVEEFLQTNNLMPIRYSYKEIKAMTKNFKEKLGEGGYGLVYKGKSRSGNFVAVKMLNKSKANGQEFINEVATIGRIHHVNVVRLVGFCVTNSKRALVYDYMPNGSLDKFIFSTSSNGTITPLSWKKAFEIAMGVARGIEYLHQGCNMQILHFDIKPHNILLDENFVPKIADFGLAKLYPVEDGYIATLTAARGTLGYMAPELFYKKIGRVSYKADVYSFGMLLMEMAGRRRNVNAHAEHSSQIYFPSWIYDQMDPTEDMEIFGSNASDEEKGIVRKLILIALWCIQMAPTDRPSMREVLEMFEGDVEGMQLPPKPLLYPPDSPLLHMQNGYSSSEESTEPLCRSITLEIEQIDN